MIAIPVEPDGIDLTPADSHLQQLKEPLLLKRWSATTATPVLDRDDSVDSWNFGFRPSPYEDPRTNCAYLIRLVVTLGAIIFAVVTSFSLRIELHRYHRRSDASKYLNSHQLESITQFLIVLFCIFGGTIFLCAARRGAVRCCLRRGDVMMAFSCEMVAIIFSGMILLFAGLSLIGKIEPVEKPPRSYQTQIDKLETMLDAMLGADIGGGLMILVVLFGTIACI